MHVSCVKRSHVWTNKYLDSRAHVYFCREKQDHRRINSCSEGAKILIRSLKPMSLSSSHGKMALRCTTMIAKDLESIRINSITVSVYTYPHKESGLGTKYADIHHKN